MKNKSKIKKIIHSFIVQLVELEVHNGGDGTNDIRIMRNDSMPYYEEMLDVIATRIAKLENI